MAKHLTQSLKRKWLPIIIERDGGFVCFYCSLMLHLNRFVFDHLNNDRSDNRVENLVVCCQSCNNRKPHDSDMQIRARDKLRQNEDSNFVGERISAASKKTEPSTEIEINVMNTEIVEQYITEAVARDGGIPYSECLNSCAYICRKKTGHGSQQTIRNYIAMLSSPAAPFDIIRDENKKKIIVRRRGN